MIYTVFLWVVVIFFTLVAIGGIIYSFAIAISFRKQVPYVPLGKQSMIKALEILGIQQGDRFIDIGSGDGQVIAQAMDMHNMEAEFSGIETKKLLVMFSKLMTKGNIFHGDALKHNYSGYNKVFLYMTSDFNELIAPKLLRELKPGSVVVSCHFDFGSAFTKKYMKEVEIGKHKLYVWEVI